MNGHTNDGARRGETCRCFYEGTCTRSGEAVSPDDCNSCGVYDLINHKPIRIANTWISCDEMLPENNDKVLAYSTCWGAIVLRRNKFSILKDVTHWMPLPKPPKTDEGGESRNEPY